MRHLGGNSFFGGSSMEAIVALFRDSVLKPFLQITFIDVLDILILATVMARRRALSLLLARTALKTEHARFALSIRRDFPTKFVFCGGMKMF